MILLFPDLDTVQLVLTTGIVPVEITMTPATVSRDATGRIHLESDFRLTKKQKEQLDQLKVVGTRRHAGDTESITTWLQLLPLIPEPTANRLTNQLPVLFELKDPTALPTLVTEMIRLGNDRQGYCWIQNAEASTSSILLRVIGPPYYTLLRAIDPGVGEPATVQAFVEQTPGVWVEWGYTHPLLRQMKPQENQIVLLKSPRNWQFLPAPVYEDIYQLLDFSLPAPSVQWQSAPLTEKWKVPLRLIPANSSDAAELWTLRGDDLSQLDHLVRDSDDRLLEQLSFSVANTASGETVCILRVRPSKRLPPELALKNATAYKPYWRIPHLFLPVGTRLHPTLRRETITQLLAEDADQLVWLQPGERESFTPERVPENSFRPLSDWVDYIIDVNHVSLRDWMQASSFDFDAMICSETNPAKPRPPADRPTRDKKPTDSSPTPALKPVAPVASPESAPEVEAAPVAPKLEVRPPSEWKIACENLEKQFLAIDGPLDDKRRMPLWPELAIANTELVASGAERRSEAAICWINALTSTTPLRQDWLEKWYYSESSESSDSLTAIKFDALLQFDKSMPTPAQVRQLLVAFLVVAHRQPQPAWLQPRLGTIAKQLETHENKLPIRGLWLAAVRLAQLAKHDVLGLARVRDRVLNRLLDSGLNAEQDLPSFLRFAGSKDAERMRYIREKATELHHTVRAWVVKSLQEGSPPGPSRSDTRMTPAYVDMMFAYGLASLGEVTLAQQLKADAKAILEPAENDTAECLISGFLSRSFSYRLDSVIAGKEETLANSPELLAELARIEKTAKEAAEKQKQERPTSGAAYGRLPMAPYIIARMREFSQILEPHEKLDAINKEIGNYKCEFRNIATDMDSSRLSRRIRELLKEIQKPKCPLETQLSMLQASLAIATRLDMDLLMELLRQIPRILRIPVPLPSPTATDVPAESGILKLQGQLLERGIFLAAHYDKIEMVQLLIDQFLDCVRTKPESQRFELVNFVAGQCLSSLRKVGLRDEIDKLLRNLQNEVLHGKSLVQMRTQYIQQSDVWAEALQTQLNLAAGWLNFGLVSQATETLEIARQELFQADSRITSPKMIVRLCQTYVRALGHGPSEFGFERLFELFQKLNPTRIKNSWTTAPYFSRSHLMLVETVILSFLGSEYAQSLSGKRWLEEEEFLVRKRIHSDVRTLLTATGMT